MNFVNKEQLHFIGDYPGRIVVFLLRRAYSYSENILDKEFLNTFPYGRIYNFDSYIDTNDGYYIEKLLASVLINVVSDTSYILIPDWYTDIEYEYINKHPMLYSITMCFEDNLDKDKYDFVITKDKPIGEQLVQYINKLKEGEE